MNTSAIITRIISVILVTFVSASLIALVCLAYGVPDPLPHVLGTFGSAPILLMGFLSLEEIR